MCVICQGMAGYVPELPAGVLLCRSHKPGCVRWFVVGVEDGRELGFGPPRRLGNFGGEKDRHKLSWLRGRPLPAERSVIATAA